MIPLYGFVQGDTLGLVVLAGPDETMGAVADRLQASASVRIAPRSRVRVLHEGRPVPLDTTLETMRVRPLDRIDVLDDEAAT
jgi:hypothetical protein